MRAALTTLALLGLAAFPAFAQQGAQSPHGTLPADLDCTSCHLQTAWRPLKAELDFDHARDTRFAMTGRHAEVGCASCHLGLRFDEPEAGPADCAGCHVDVHQGSLGQDCVRCHSTSSFQDLSPLALHARTSFPLTGSHLQLACESCHMDEKGGAFSPLPTDCVACHQADYETAASVDHVAEGFGTTCQDCHGTLSWASTGGFDHLARSGFALLGRHDALRCEACHVIPGNALKFPAPSEQEDCVACHRADYDRQHAGSGFATTCADCHGVDSWEAEGFDHASTGFALVGAHTPLECSACHMDGNALRFPVPSEQEDCVACHQADYDREHAGSGFATTCADCHGVDSWDAEDFDHAATGFDLRAAHASLECAACHVEPGNALRFPEPSEQEDCVACHQADYDQEHAGSGFATTCADCHGEETWQGAAFDHASTGFALVGAHSPLDCAACHIQPGNQLRWPAPASQEDCLTCHQADYDQQHAGSGFSMMCLDCHTVETWQGALFDHASTGFDLVGAHTPLECAACHIQPGNQLRWPTPASQEDCVTCHQTDYNEQHAGSGFSTMCLDCHTVDTWQGALFDHGSTGFDLVGAHAPLECFACHIQPGNQLRWPPPASQEDCVACHQADYNQEHGGSGYPTTCIDCHTVDAWDADFDHDSRFFPIFSGRHANEWATCQTCHIDPGNFAVFSCLTCHAHNQNDTDEHHHEVGGYAYESALCYECHPDGRSDD